MKSLVIIAALVAAAAAGNETLPHRDATDAETLTAKEVRKYFEPYIAGVRDCYTANAKAGDRTLRLELIIQRDGTVFKFGFAAPREGAKAITDLDRCLRPLSETWHFPPRRGFTSTVVPFLFLRTNAPGAGPKIGSER